MMRWRADRTDELIENHGGSTEAGLERIVVIVVAGTFMPGAFALSAWLKQRQPRNTYRQRAEAEYGPRRTVRFWRGHLT